MALSPDECRPSADGLKVFSWLTNHMEVEGFRTLYVGGAISGQQVPPVALGVDEFNYPRPSPLK
jgi:hypothetical protein